MSRAAARSAIASLGTAGRRGLLDCHGGARWDERLTAPGLVSHGRSLKLTCFPVPPSGVAMST